MCTIMRTVTVSPRSKAVNTLLAMAQENVLLLQAVDGRQFVLTPVIDLQAFYIGDSDELADEIAISRGNQALIKFLDARGREAKPGHGTSIEEVRRQLGL